MSTYKNQKGGRPAKHTSKMLRAILDAMLRPYTGLDDVAKRYKVSVQAIFRWQKQSAQDEADGLAEVRS